MSTTRNYGRRHKKQPKLGHRPHYNHPKPGEPVVIPLGGVRVMGCCDCGLIHTVAYSLEDGKIVERVWRNERSTSMFRRHMAKDGRLVPHPESNVYILPLRIRSRRGIKRVELKIEPGDPNVAVDRTTAIHNRHRANNARRRIPRSKHAGAGR